MKILFVSLGSVHVENFDTYEEAEFAMSQIEECNTHPDHSRIIREAGLNFVALRLYKQR